MQPSYEPDTQPVLGEGHYTVALAGAGHRTLEVTRAGPDFRAGPFIVSIWPRPPALMVTELLPSGWRSTTGSVRRPTYIRPRPSRSPLHLTPRYRV